MHLNFTDRHGNGLIGKTIEFYATGDTVAVLFTAITDDLGRVDPDDYDGSGGVIAAGIYDLKCIDCAEDGTDQWETIVGIKSDELSIVYHGSSTAAKGWRTKMDGNDLIVEYTIDGGVNWTEESRHVLP